MHAGIILLNYSTGIVSRTRPSVPEASSSILGSGRQSSNLQSLLLVKE